jgi:hypothetical protein
MQDVTASYALTIMKVPLSLQSTFPSCLTPVMWHRCNVSTAYGDDFDSDSVNEDDINDNEQDYDVDYDHFLAFVMPWPPSFSMEERGITIVVVESFISMQDSASNTVVHGGRVPQDKAIRV